ncbi:hypothetical protein [Xanthomonas campestris]|uniref:hypothetical protein n=1 Tax=Xanthomonas campestris TaxID=339 RepID=UPI001E2A489A|nr:hypothetical protein [Xanthomonas campestris]MCC5072669.1 hypothetical protein [Xanthomonas campestris pv. plantaginis]
MIRPLICRQRRLAFSESPIPNLGLPLFLGRRLQAKAKAKAKAKASAPVARVAFVLAKVTKTVLARRDPVR